MSEPGRYDALTRLRRDYEPAFLAYVNQRQERGLQAAYEMGRAAMAAGVGLLDLVQVHHAVFGQLLRSLGADEAVDDVVDAAAAFLVEAVAPFEMAQRGFMESVAATVDTSGTPARPQRLGGEEARGARTRGPEP